MALKIRLRPQGRTNHVCYRLVVTEATARRNGKYIEALGWYDPNQPSEDKQISLNEERIDHWLSHGAIATEKVVNLIKRTSAETYTKLIDREEHRRQRLCKQRKERRKRAAAAKA
ncbi:MAG: 30S ribosomal protein S16 [Chlamydiia bacterium]|nr:30S ribosomal protein S16 [Chlamydiia bacterium]